ncbi:hypothetical protein BaRGS_00001803 [Batillaria attramentaria]|uniref:Uncharacterized protein n=1 Tax=Batillaria attramentaria TaxID=370345 RepID=A0ABD0M6N2_9CAEN
MASGASVSEFPTAQLITFLSKVGISQGGLDSVWEKEVTGSMLCEFCEEDIKDVFTEFKDRFLIRKLLRDLADKPQSRHKPSTLTTPPPYSGLNQGQRLLPLQHGSHVSTSKQVDSQDVSLSQRRAGSDSQVSETDDDNDNERKVFYGGKKPCLDDVLSVPKVPSSSGSLHASQSSPAGRSYANSTAESFGLKPLSPFSVFMSKPDIITSFNAAHSRSHTQASHVFGNSDEQSRTFGPNTGQGDQALCLKKTVSSSQVRNETASPATQPSSTTPDNLVFQGTKNLDLASAMAVSQLASKYSAPDILSKKAQRARPSSPQKLGSVLIRNAAQQANLWVSAPCLRNISPAQKQAFLSYVYSVAPHIREYEQLLWQRLSETLQNRRKYLLDKKLGKRGVNSSSEQTSPTEILGGFSWNMTRHVMSSSGANCMDELNFDAEASSSQDRGCDFRMVKTEPE